MALMKTLCPPVVEELIPFLFDAFFVSKYGEFLDVESYLIGLSTIYFEKSEEKRVMLFKVRPVASCLCKFVHEYFRYFVAEGVGPRSDFCFAPFAVSRLHFFALMEFQAFDKENTGHLSQQDFQLLLKMVLESEANSIVPINYVRDHYYHFYLFLFHAKKKKAQLFSILIFS
jgi:hypothetical protein